MKFRILIALCVMSALAACSQTKSNPQPPVAAPHAAPALSPPPKDPPPMPPAARAAEQLRREADAAPQKIVKNDASSSTPKVDTNLVLISGNDYCPANIKKQSTKRWTRLGAHPYMATQSAAIDRFVEVPQVVRDTWKKMVGENKGTSGVIKEGKRFCSMMYSVGDSHRRWDNVQAALKDIPELRTLEYTVEHDGYRYIYGIPPKKEGGCNNSYWHAEKVKSA